MVLGVPVALSPLPPPATPPITSSGSWIVMSGVPLALLPLPSVILLPPFPSLPPLQSDTSVPNSSALITLTPFVPYLSSGTHQRLTRIVLFQTHENRPYDFESPLSRVSRSLGSMSWKAGSRYASKLHRFIVSLAASSHCSKKTPTVVFEGTNAGASS